MWFDAVLAVVALAAALSTRPWRAVGAGGPPWPWLAWAAALPLLWGADRVADTPLALPLSGACLLMLMAGWPLAVLVFVPVAAVSALAGGLDAALALQRAVGLGLLPATLAMALAAAIRRWLPNHLFVYILGRGFFATALALTASAALQLLVHAPPATVAAGDWLLARALASWGDAFLTGMLVAIFVAFRPQWLATYADRVWLPRDGPPAA